MPSRPSRTIAVAASAALISTGLLIASPASAAPATTPIFYGQAYGTAVDLGPFSSGQTSPLSVCAAAPNTSYRNDLARVDLGLPGSAGAVSTTLATTADRSTVTSKVAGTSLLGGLIKADAITATSNYRQVGATATATGSTEIVGLKISGVPRVVPVGASAKIVIPGVATVTLNRQTSATVHDQARFTVEALRVDVLKGNALGLVPGAIVVSSATSGVHVPGSSQAGGEAYGTRVDVAGVVSLGATAPVGMPCGGTGGAVVTNSVASVKLPTVLSTGVIASTGQSVQTSSSTTSTFSNAVGDVDLLNGVVTATAVKARASSTRTSAGLQNTSAGSTISNLRIRGARVDLGSGPNNKVAIFGVGTLTVNKTTASPDGLDVVGLELKLDTERLGLKAGTVIQVAVAKSRVSVN